MLGGGVPGDALRVEVWGSEADDVGLSGFDLGRDWAQQEEEEEDDDGGEGDQGKICWESSHDFESLMLLEWFDESKDCIIYCFERWFFLQKNSPDTRFSCQRGCLFLKS